MNEWMNKKNVKRKTKGTQLLRSTRLLMLIVLGLPTFGPNSATMMIHSRFLNKKDYLYITDINSLHVFQRDTCIYHRY